MICPDEWQKVPPVHGGVESVPATRTRPIPIAVPLDRVLPRWTVPTIVQHNTPA
jgi:hypothetical protein